MTNIKLTSATDNPANSINCSSEKPGVDISSASSAAASSAFRYPVPASVDMAPSVHESKGSDVPRPEDDGTSDCADEVGGIAEDEKGVATTAREASVDDDRMRLRRVEAARRAVALRLNAELQPIISSSSSSSLQVPSLSLHRRYVPQS